MADSINKLPIKKSNPSTGSGQEINPSIDSIDSLQVNSGQVEIF